MTWTLTFISRTPADPCISCTSYPPIFTVPLHLHTSQNFLLVSASLVPCLGSACVSPHTGIGFLLLLFDVLDLSSGLSFEHVMGFSLVHSLLGFLGCEIWVRLN